MFAENCLCPSSRDCSCAPSSDSPHTPPTSWASRRLLPPLPHTAYPASPSGDRRVVDAPCLRLGDSLDEDRLDGVSNAARAWYSDHRLATHVDSLVGLLRLDG